jgi:hypothetical protein
LRQVASIEQEPIIEPIGMGMDALDFQMTWQGLQHAFSERLAIVMVPDGGEYRNTKFC